MNTQLNNNSTLCVILTWNTSDLTINLLNQLEEKEPSSDYCIIDNNSISAEREILYNYLLSKDNHIIVENDLSISEKRYKYYLVMNSENLGYAKGNNRGVKLANNLKYRYVAIINNDIVLNSSVLKNMVEYLEDNRDTVLIGPKIIDSYGKQQGPFVKETLFHTLVFPLLFPVLLLFKNSKYSSITKYGSTQLNNSNESSIYRLMGCFLLFNTKKLVELGMFDENTFLFYEEAIISEKIFRAGYKIKFFPDVFVTHLSSMSIKALSDQLYSYKIDSGCYYYKNYRDYNYIQVCLYKLGNIIMNYIWMALGKKVRQILIK